MMHPLSKLATEKLTRKTHTKTYLAGERVPGDVKGF